MTKNSSNNLIQVSILIVNYNGRHLLEECLESLFAIQFSKEKFEVVIVDNDSQDGSVPFIKRNFPQVILIESQENLGFAGGNNLAFTRARGKYIVLLNSDTNVDKLWLESLVNTAENNPKVGLINSKLYFGIPFVPIKIKSDIALKADIYGDNDYSPVGVIVEDIEAESENLTNLIHYSTGFYSPNKDGNYTTRWTNGEATVLLPFTGQEADTFTMLIHGHPHTRHSDVDVSILVGETEIKKTTVQSKGVKEITIKLERVKIYKNLIWLVQNAGNVLFKNGLSRDRGAVLTKESSQMVEFYDYDSNYYKESVQITSVCGASCLIKREVIDQVGLFDPNFFMYYEDVDLSLSAWRMGWDILYEPKSIVYHKHKTSTSQESDVFFSSLILKNHFLLLIKHFPIKMWLKKLLFFSAKLILVLIVLKLFYHVKYYGKYYRRFAKEVDSRYTAGIKLKKAFRSAWKTRHILRTNQLRGFEELKDKLY